MTIKSIRNAKNLAGQTVFLRADLNVPIKVRYEKFDGKFEIMRKLIKASRLSKADQGKFLDIIKERLRRLGLSQ